MAYEGELQIDSIVPASSFVDDISAESQNDDEQEQVIISKVEEDNNV